MSNSIIKKNPCLKKNKNYGKSLVKSQNKTKNKIWLIILLASLATTVICVSLLFKLFFEYKHVDALNEEIANELVIPKEEIQTETPPNENSAPEVSTQKDVPFYYDHDKALEKNRYSVGFIWIPSVNTRLPIVQGENNSQFLRTGYDFRYSRGGTIFVDASLRAGLNSTHLIVYGHNLNNGAMFSKNNNYRSESFYNKSEENKYFYIYTPNMLRKYKIYACFNTTARNNDVYEIDMPKENLSEYATKIANNYAWYDTNTDLGDVSQVTSLVCCYANNMNKRWIVQGTLIEETPFKAVENDSDYMLNSNIERIKKEKEEEVKRKEAEEKKETTKTEEISKEKTDTDK